MEVVISTVVKYICSVYEKIMHINNYFVVYSGFLQDRRRGNMPIIPLTCPSCGASLRVDSNKDAAICDYCGRPYIVKDAIVNNYINNVTNVTNINNIKSDNVNLYPQKDFEINGGKLVKYHGESTNVIIPDNVKYIDVGVFRDMSIVSVEIPSSVTEIGNIAFQNCKSLLSVNIPPQVKKIGYETFNNCISLKCITLPSGITDICDGAFSLCTELREVTLPSGVKKIDRSAFASCKKLQKITIPSSVTEIGHDAFYGCSDLCGISLLSTNIKIIEDGLFEGCTSLKRIEIPSGVVEIKDSAFMECTALESITIPSSVKRIGSHVFNGCRSLKNITFASDNIEFGWYDFEGCESLETLKGLSYDKLKTHKNKLFENSPVYKSIQAEEYKRAGRCQYCGGAFGGIFTKRCYNCKREKDY